MKCLVLAAAVTASLVCVSAQAADINYRSPSNFAAAQYAPQTWTGLYVGGTLGYGFGKSTMSADLPFGLGPMGGDNSLSGIIGGGTLGYNYQWGRVVLGLETDLNFGSIKGAGSQDFLVGGFLPVTAGQQASIDYSASLRGRLGYDFNGWLFYGTVGPAIARATVSTQVATSGFALGSQTESRTLRGWTYGGGVEKRLAPNWSAKLEYLHADYGSYDSSMPTIFGAVPLRGHLSDDKFRAGLNYHF